MRKIGKKALSLLLALVLCLGLVPVSALAAGPTSGKCGDNLTWSLQNGTLTISGTGAMAEYSGYFDTPWFSHSESGAITAVIIEKGVTSICEDAFLDCLGLTKVSVSDGVTRIGQRAFSGCTNLSSVTLGSGLTQIKYAAFESCSSLTQISIPDGVTEIQGAAFMDCTSLASITIPGSVASLEPVEIGDNQPFGVFDGCTGLRSVVLQEGVTSIGGYTFAGCSGLTSVTIPDSVTGIGEFAFWGCKSLTSVSIPGGVTSIGACAFSDTGLTSVSVPGSVKSIGAFAFTGLKDLYYSGSEAQWNAIAIEFTDSDPLEDTTIHYNTAGPDTAPAFTDILPDAYYHDAVYWAVEEKITNGTSASTFTPDRTCTATEILTLLWRAAGQPESKAQLPFTVNAGLEYAEGALRWALEKGMIDRSFVQTAPCTRASAVKYIWQAAGSPAAAAANSFTDVPAGADYAQAVAWAVSRKIVNGTSPTAFSPNDTCTRAQIVTLLHRTYK